MVGYGRIVRDEDGNVIDIIIDGEDEEKEKEEEESRWGKPLNPEDDGFEKAPVQAKTQVVRGECNLLPPLAVCNVASGRTGTT